MSQEQSFQQNSETKKNIRLWKIASTVRTRLVDEIMTSEIAVNKDLVDNTDAIDMSLRHEILKEYLNVDQSEEGFLNITQISQKILPWMYLKSPIIAVQVTSLVAQEMYAYYLIDMVGDEDEIDEFGILSVLEKVKQFHEDRVSYARSMSMKNRSSEQQRHSGLMSLIKQGKQPWSSTDEELLIELVHSGICLWGSGSNNPGKINRKKLHEKFNELAEVKRTKTSIFRKIDNDELKRKGY